MSPVATTAKVMFWIGVGLSILTAINVARGTVSIIVWAAMTGILIAPHLYLEYQNGQSNAPDSATDA